MTPEPVAWVEAVKAASAGLASIVSGLLLVSIAPLAFTAFVDHISVSLARARRRVPRGLARSHPYR